MEGARRSNASLLFAMVLIFMNLPVVNAPRAIARPAGDDCTVGTGPKDRRAIKDSAARYTSADVQNPNVDALISASPPPALRTLPTGFKTNYDTKLLSAFPIQIKAQSGPELTLHEGDIVSVTGTLKWVSCESKNGGDSDYHMEISGPNLTTCFIAEIPSPKFAEKAALKTKFLNLRRFVERNFFGSNPPSGPVPSHPKVSVTGQLFFDLHHYSTKPGASPGGGRGKGGAGCTVTTLWEIHPVLKLAAGS